MWWFGLGFNMVWRDCFVVGVVGLRFAWLRIVSICVYWLVLSGWLYELKNSNYGCLLGWLVTCVMLIFCGFLIECQISWSI